MDLFGLVILQTGVLWICLCSSLPVASAFAPLVHHRRSVSHGIVDPMEGTWERLPQQQTQQQRQQQARRHGTTTSSQLNMFMGSDGGILGIGTPELVRWTNLFLTRL